ncbi:cation diffusion facilitator family transporter [soil metagenome]
MRLFYFPAARLLDEFLPLSYNLRMTYSATQAEEKRAMILSLVVGIVLMAIKFVAYGMTGSAAIFSDALEGIVNVLASCFALYAVSLAARPADAEHPYGHGKIEFMSAGFEGGMILIASLVMAARVGQEIYQGPHVENVGSGLILIAAAMFVNGGVGWYLLQMGRKRGAITLEADGKHLLSDAVTSAGVLVALAFVKLTGWKWADPIAALVVTLYIGFIAAGLLRKAVAGLMDQQDIDDEKRLTNLLDNHIGPDKKEPHICSYHKLRHRHSGRYHWVDFHMMVPAWWDITRAHSVASAIEYEIEQMLGEGNATAHIEPCAKADCPNCAQ